MFNPKSDYALNKMDPEAIVYIDSLGTLVRLTLEDFASPEEFQRWKEWSDNNYHEREKQDHIFFNHTVPASGGISVQSAEDVLLEVQNQQERQELLRLLMAGFDTRLTLTQQRRLWLYCVDGLTVRRIAEAEGVQHPSIVECLAAARKKLLEFLKNMA